MPPPLVVALFALSMLVGVATGGLMGLLGGAGFALLFWWQSDWLVEALHEDRDRREGRDRDEL